MLIPSIAFLAIVVWQAIERLRLIRRNIELNKQYDELLSSKKSSEVRLGQISEQLAPFLKNFNHDPKKAHFIGNPIDYIVFEEDGVTMVEVKSGKSKLSKGQQDIKKLIEEGKVKFEEIRIDGK